MQEWQELHQHVRDCQCAVKACGQAQTMYTERAKGAKINAAKCATNKATAKKKLKVARASLKDFVKNRSLRRKGLRTDTPVTTVTTPNENKSTEGIEIGDDSDDRLRCSRSRRRCCVLGRLLPT